MSMDDRELRDALLPLHARIRAAVRARLARDGAGRVAAEGASDVTFALDVPAEEEVERFARELSSRVPLSLVTEGGGLTNLSDRPRLRLISDPVDGTRNLMFGLRSAWALTAFADERGAATSLSDVRVAVQSELPLENARTYHVLTAVRGGGARIERRAVDDDRLLDERALVASADARLDNGYYVFFKFSPEDRTVLARLEEDVLSRVVRAFGVDRRTLYDDQYISNAGQLFLAVTGRYRMVADLRGLVGARLRIENFTTKPYDVCCALIAREAGVPVTDGGESGAFRPLDVPLDATHRVSFVAYANDAVRAQLEPLLAESIAAVLPDGGARA